MPIRKEREILAFYEDIRYGRLGKCIEHHNGSVVRAALESVLEWVIGHTDEPPYDLCVVHGGCQDQSDEDPLNDPTTHGLGFGQSDDR